MRNYITVYTTIMLIFDDWFRYSLWDAASESRSTFQ